MTNPCTEDLSTMAKTSCGLHCSKCRKDVVDFTNLTDIELIDVFKKKPDTCGLFRMDQLDRRYQYDELIPERKPLRFWVSFLTFISFLGFNEAGAQDRKATHKKEQRSDESPKLAGPRVYCKVVDDRGLPVAGVKVRTYAEGTRTDLNGLFDLEYPFEKNEKPIIFGLEYHGMITFQQLTIADTSGTATFTVQRERPERTGAMNAGGGSMGDTITIIDGKVVEGYVEPFGKRPGFFEKIFGRKR